MCLILWDEEGVSGNLGSPVGGSSRECRRIVYALRVSVLAAMSDGAVALSDDVSSSDETTLFRPRALSVIGELPFE